MAKVLAKSAQASLEQGDFLRRPYFYRCFKILSLEFRIDKFAERLTERVIYSERADELVECGHTKSVFFLVRSVDRLLEESRSLLDLAIRFCTVF